MAGRPFQLSECRRPGDERRSPADDQLLAVRAPAEPTRQETGDRVRRLEIRVELGTLGCHPLLPHGQGPPLDGALQHAVRVLERGTVPTPGQAAAEAQPLEVTFQLDGQFLDPLAQ
jgi:hypothetical protein